MPALAQLKDIPFFFIIGRPRSGTTLLRTLLDAHPNIIVPPEYPVLLDLYNKYGKITRWEKPNLEAFYSDFKRKQPREFWKYEYLDMDEPALKDTLAHLSGKEVGFQEVFKAFYYHSRSIFGEKKIQLIGDKNPIYATFTNRLFSIFPQARFIYLTRDYRDNYRSISKFDFEAPNVILQSYRWKYATKKFISLASNNHGQFINIRYEDLVSDPEKELSAICHFLDVDYDPVMLEFYKNADEAIKIVGEEDFNKFHNGLTQPIHSENLYEWKKHLSQKEINLADSTVGDYAEIMGYERSYKKSPFKTKMAILPWRIYGNTLYKAMSAAEFLPSPVRRQTARLLPLLAKAYHALKGSKK